MWLSRQIPSPGSREGASWVTPFSVSPRGICTGPELFPRRLLRTIDQKPAKTASCYLKFICKWLPPQENPLAHSEGQEEKPCELGTVALPAHLLCASAVLSSAEAFPAQSIPSLHCKVRVGWSRLTGAPSPQLHVQ